MDSDWMQWFANPVFDRLTVISRRLETRAPARRNLEIEVPE